MSHLSKIFEEAPVRVQNRNGFDLSHTHAGTSKTGQLVPVLTKVIAPNSTISLGVDAEVNLPPIVAPFYGKIDFAIEGFVVPMSILYGGFKQFISNQEMTQFPSTQTGFTNPTQDSIVDGRNVAGLGYTFPGDKPGYALPYFDLATVDTNNTAGFRTLYNANDNLYAYMGCNIRNIVGNGFNVSLLPALAYHKICDTFYRNTKLTRTWFAVNPNVGLLDTEATNNFASIWNRKNVSLVWHSFYTATAVANPTAGTGNGTSSAQFSDVDSLTFPDGVSVFSTRQRTYMRDYFTSAVASPQQGGSAQLSFDTSTSTSEFTINALRAANALQKFLETNNLSGEYSDMIRNRWGVRPIDADFDEPHYLGRVVLPVYQREVAKQDAAAATTAGGTENPFVSDGLLGAKAGNAMAGGEGSICDNFNVSCWSYLMVLASLVPHANYNYGINRELTMLSLGDFPAPELQSVGMEEIKNYELIGGLTNVPVSAVTSTFGYIPRYSRFKYMDDRVSGELNPYASLHQYQLQRGFTNIPQLSTDFVTIAQSALDDVLSVSTSTMNMTCWWQIYFKLHIVMPLADFCIPTLGELGDTHTIKATVAGSRL